MDDSEVAPLAGSTKNEALQELDVLVGDWKLTMTNSWFLESLDIEIHGSAKFEWLGDAFLVMRSEMGGAPAWDFVFGRNDSREQLVCLYHDERGVCRVFDTTFGDGRWTMLREDPDFHQRFVGTVQPDRIESWAEASEDFGKTWRKDLQLIFERES
jgi:hypothetical protein